MNTSSIEFGALTSQYPAESRAIERIEHIFDKKGAEHPLENVFDLAKPSSSYVLVNMMMKLVELGLLKQCYRVQSTSGNGGIGDYDSLPDIPDVIYDHFLGREVLIDFDSIKVIYKSSK